MNIQYVESFAVVGIAIRTRNKDEMNPAVAKIQGLWQTFFTEISPKLDKDAKVYGVYTNYASDEHGFFDVIAGANTLKLDSNDIPTHEITTIHIQSGNYLVFSAIGEMPKAVISLWQEIWQYFESDDCTHKRAYTTDFEYYKGEHEIEIYIAIT